MITREQFEKMKQFDGDFYNAVNCQFVRNMTSVKRQILAEVYRDVFGKEAQGLKSGCGHCTLSACQKLGPLYFEYKNAQKPQEAPESNETPDVVPAPSEEQKPVTVKKTAQKKEK